MPRRSHIDMAEVGSRIKKLRGNMLQEEFARLLDVSQGHLSKLESGKIAPSLEILLFLSTRFGKSIDWIVQGED